MDDIIEFVVRGAGIGFFVGAFIILSSVFMNSLPSSDKAIVDQILVPCIEQGYSRDMCISQLKVRLGMLE